MSKKSLTIISPTYNEVENVRNYFDEMIPIVKEIENVFGLEVIVTILDNCSTDATFESLLKHCSETNGLKFKLVSWVRNYGVTASTYGGIAAVETDAVVVIDFDLQDPPKLIPQLVKLWIEGNDFAYGSRIKREETWKLKVLRRLFNSLGKLLRINASIPVESGMWLLDRKVIIDLISNPPSTKFLAGAIGNRGYRSSFIKYDRRARLYGSSKFSIAKYFNYAFEALLSNPLRIARLSISFSFVTFSLGGLLEVFLLVCRYAFHLEIPNGLISTIFFQVVVYSVIFLALGVIGEYLSGMYSVVFRPESPIPRIIVTSEEGEIARN